MSRTVYSVGEALRVGAESMTNETPPTVSLAEFCPTPRPSACCQQPVFMGNAGFIVWRCKNCGSESWT